MTSNPYTTMKKGIEINQSFDLNLLDVKETIQGGL